MESTTALASPSGSGVTARLAPTIRPWANISPDLLLEVSNRLNDAANFVRFHAVCTAWRDAAPSLFSSTVSRPMFSPWILGLYYGHIVHSTVDIQCTTSFKDVSDGCSDGNDVTVMVDRNWVARTDGTASWIFFASPEPRLLDLLTRAVTLLPRFPDNDEIRVPMKNARGVVYNDGTIFLYRFLLTAGASTFTAAILHPGSRAWTVMKSILEVPIGSCSDEHAVYHDGKVLVCVGDYFWSVLTPGDFGGCAGLQSRWSKSEKRKYSPKYNYVLESHGELLWASVLFERDCFRGHTLLDLTAALSVTVHALENRAGGVMRWAVRDGWSLADRIMFLGSPASFTVDAHKLGMNGGCAYFVFRSRVFRYGLVTGKTEFIRHIPLRWGTRGTRDGPIWMWRYPKIAPIQEIREGLRLYPNKKQKICN